MTKNWKTSLVGLVILGGLVHTAITDGFGITEAISGLVAIGLLLAKDHDKSHSKTSTVVPDREYPKGKY